MAYKLTLPWHQCDPLPSSEEYPSGTIAECDGCGKMFQLTRYGPPTHLSNCPQLRDVEELRLPCTCPAAKSKRWIYFKD